MALTNDRYTYRVTWSEDDNEYVGLCAEFPSLSWLARTPEAALRGIRKLVADVVIDMRTSEESIPEPIASTTGHGCPGRSARDWYERPGPRFAFWSTTWAFVTACLRSSEN